MTNEVGATLSVWRKLLMATAGVVIMVGPVVFGAAHSPELRAQSLGLDAASGRAFVSVSIKTNTSGDSRSDPMTMVDGQFAVKNKTLRDLIQTIYGAQLEGGPDWLSSDRFDIEAKAEGNPTREQLHSMVRKLLADRFHLVVHSDTKMVPVYALVLARSDGTLGPQLRPSACTGRETRPVLPVVPRLGIPNDDTDAASPLPCGVVRTRRGTLVARGLTMENLAEGGLSTILDRKVMDRTGLTGQYDLNAEWKPAVVPVPAMHAGAGPDTFTALDDQLGLKLESAQGPVDILVIDRVERPIGD